MSWRRLSLRCARHPTPTNGAERALSLDNLVGARRARRRDGKAHRPRGFEIDAELENRRLLHGQIARPGALEDLRGVQAALAEGVHEAWPIAHQAAGRGIFPVAEDRGNAMTRRQRCDLVAPAAEVWIDADDQPAVAVLHEARERRVDFSLAAGLQDIE